MSHCRCGAVLQRTGYYAVMANLSFLGSNNLCSRIIKNVEQDIYVDKIKSLIEDAKINTLTVMIMQVPCCSGLLRLAEQAAQAAKRKVPIKYIVVGMQGEILQEAWI